MFAVFYIGKRTLFDILRAGVFWVAVALAGFIIFSMLYWGWRQIEAEPDGGRSGFRSRAAPAQEEPGKKGDDPSRPVSESPTSDWDPLSQMKPENVILWHVYAITIGFANLLAIFVMMGLLGREIERRTIDMLIARPVSRGQIFLGKLLAGWVALAIFMILLTGWSLVCMVWGGMGLQPNYINACAIGTLAPFLVSAITLLFTIWMRGFLAGLLGVIVTFASGTTGMFMLKLLGIELLKLEWPVRIIYKILPPMNVIGQQATDHLETDMWFRFVYGMFEDLGPTAADGLYTQMWQVWAYLGVILVLSWLSFFRRQFT